MSGAIGEITELLQRAQHDRDASESLYRLVEQQLRRIAQRCFAQERKGHTLQPTILIDDAYHALVVQGRGDWRSRKQFYTAAAEVMRHLLVDYARVHGAAKRGGGQKKIPLDELKSVLADGKWSLARELNDAIEALKDQSPAAFEVFQLRYYVGLTWGSIAEALGLTREKVSLLHLQARTYLRRQLIGDDGHED